MAMNRIQFQPGLSLPDFFSSYGTELQCGQALEAVRWPKGFICPRCTAMERKTVVPSRNPRKFRHHQIQPFCSTDRVFFLDAHLTTR